MNGDAIQATSSPNGNAQRVSAAPRPRLREVVFCLCLACTENASLPQPLAPSPSVTSSAVEIGPTGPPGPQGLQGPTGPQGATGSAGAFELLDGDGQRIATLLSVRLAGAAPVYTWYDSGRFMEVDAEGAWMHSTGVFYETEDCTGETFLPSSFPGRLEADTLATFVLDWNGPGGDGLIVRAPGATETTRNMVTYTGADPQGNRWCLLVNMGPTPGIPVTLTPTARRKGPLSLRER